MRDISKYFRGPKLCWRN